MSRRRRIARELDNNTHTALFAVARFKCAENIAARTLHHYGVRLECKIAQGFDWMKDFPSERNNGVYFRERNILQAIKD